MQQFNNSDNVPEEKPVLTQNTNFENFDNSLVTESEPVISGGLDPTGLNQDGFSQPPEQTGIESIDPENIDLVKLIDQPDWKTILIELVKTNKMDPWNIDLIELSSQYLKKISTLEKTDLRLPANAILACSILLHFKSKILRLTDIEEDDEDNEMTPEEKQAFEAILPDLTNEFRSKEARVSLDDLVNSIEKILNQKKKSRQSNETFFDRPEFKIPVSNFDIDTKMIEIYDRIKSGVDSEKLITFTQLTQGMAIPEIVESFIPLLFLANKEKLRVWQEVFFDEIFISLLEEN